MVREDRGTIGLRFSARQPPRGEFPHASRAQSRRDASACACELSCPRRRASSNRRSWNVWQKHRAVTGYWIPACAGMTEQVERWSSLHTSPSRGGPASLLRRWGGGLSARVGARWLLLPRLVPHPARETRADLPARGRYEEQSDMRIGGAAAKLHGSSPPSSEDGDAPRYGAEIARCLVFVPMKRAEAGLVTRRSGSKLAASHFSGRAKCPLQQSLP